jgi:hypothetical protein
MEEKQIRKYTKSEKVIQSALNNTKHFKLEENQTYFDTYAKTLGETSALQYKSAIIRLEEATGKDLMTVTVKDVENYVSTCKEGKTAENQRRYIQAFLKYTFTNFSEQATIKADANTVLWLMDDVNKKLMNILMNK